MPNLKPWYASLRKPAWSPPNRAFAPVWTLIYTLIGISCANVFGATPLQQPRALKALLLNATLNFLWPPLFFGMKRLRPAAVLAFALLASAGFLSVVFAQTAGVLSTALLLPYCAWLSYAAALNVRLWQLNKWKSIGGSSGYHRMAGRWPPPGL